MPPHPVVLAVSQDEVPPQLPLLLLRLLHGLQAARAGRGRWRGWPLCLRVSVPAAGCVMGNAQAWMHSWFHCGLARGRENVGAKQRASTGGRAGRRGVKTRQDARPAGSRALLREVGRVVIEHREAELLGHDSKQRCGWEAPAGAWGLLPHWCAQCCCFHSYLFGALINRAGVAKG